MGWDPMPYLARTYRFVGLARGILKALEGVDGNGTCRELPSILGAGRPVLGPADLRVVLRMRGLDGHPGYATKPQHWQLYIEMLHTVPMGQQTVHYLRASSPNDSHWKEIAVGTTTTVDLQNVKLESIRMTKPSPVEIVEGKVRIDEDRMKDGEPYAFQYKGEYYLLARTDGKLVLYGLR